MGGVTRRLAKKESHHLSGKKKASRGKKKVNSERQRKRGKMVIHVKYRNFRPVTEKTGSFRKGEGKLADSSSGLSQSKGEKKKGKA